MSRRSNKQQLIEELIELFRTNGNQENAFDNLAAKRLGVSRSDLDCLNTIENSGGLTAGELAREAGLTTGAVTGVIDRLERVGFARRSTDPTDRRKVIVEVTPEFYAQARSIWEPMARDWQQTMSGLTAAELRTAAEFLRASTEIGARHMERLRDDN